MNTKTQNYHAQVSFLDAGRHKVSVNLGVKDGRFSISGDTQGSMGQIVDHINPATDAQRKLIELWNTWHLNDMHAGTAEQEAVIESAQRAGQEPKSCESFNDWAVPLLKTKGLYEVPHPDKLGETYRYGSGWLTRELPEDFLETLENLVAELRDEKSKGTKLSELPEFDDQIAAVEEKRGDQGADAELIVALAIMFGLTVEELGDIDISERPRVTVQGVDYLAGTDEDMDVAWDRELESYLDEGCVEGAKSPYFDRERWKNDARADGRGHALNRYDGGEESVEYNGIDYYAYRQ